ncbi:MAG TPA: CsbD family protein [Burkholderiaceae bacterium]|nr:CsbD family protein [Burkholderiaceae bacterium]
MNGDRIKGAIKDVAGKAQREAGKLTGNDSARAEGTARQVEGKVQKGVGVVRDAVDRDRDAVKPHRPGGTGRDGAL